MNTNNAFDISRMLCYCSSLSSFPEVSIWDTNNVTNINCMLAACSLLSSLFNISNWNTNNATNMNGMLTQCSSLLSVFDFSKIHKVKSLFYLPGKSKIFIKTIIGKIIFIYDSYDISIQNIKNKSKFMKYK